MSQATTDLSTVEFAEGVIPLLKEYTQKLHSLTQSARGTLDQALDEAASKAQLRITRQGLADLVRYFNSLFPVLKQLAQAVSQRLEHTEMDDLTRLELRVRLAEFEASLLLAKDTIHAVENTLP